MQQKSAYGPHNLALHFEFQKIDPRENGAFLQIFTSGTHLTVEDESEVVTIKGHVFARWEDDKERFNIEGTNEGLNCFPDEYYQHWPFELTQGEIQSGRYLRSLTLKEELALFLQNRGMCLKAAGKFGEARSSWEKARELAPNWAEHDMLIASVSRK